MVLPIHRTAAYEKFPFYMGRKLYNKLPAALKIEGCNNKFKRELRDFLMEKLYYSVKDYLS